MRCQRMTNNNSATYSRNPEREKHQDRPDIVQVLERLFQLRCDGWYSPAIAFFLGNTSKGHDRQQKSITKACITETKLWLPNITLNLPIAVIDDVAQLEVGLPFSLRLKISGLPSSRSRYA